MAAVVAFSMLLRGNLHRMSPSGYCHKVKRATHPQTIGFGEGSRHGQPFGLDLRAISGESVPAEGIEPPTFWFTKPLLYR